MNVGRAGSGVLKTAHPTLSGSSGVVSILGSGLCLFSLCLLIYSLCSVSLCLLLYLSRMLSWDLGPTLF